VNNTIFHNQAALQAYATYERQIYVRHLEVGCYLVMALMPAGVVLDYFVYPKELYFFFMLRLFAAVFGGLVWLALQTKLREKVGRYLSLSLAVMPAFFICLMIYTTDGVSSSYYAGLNLVLLSVALVMRWSVDLSVAASVSVIAMYVMACLLHGPMTRIAQPGVLVNNLYFLLLTAIIVVVSGWIHHTLRVREFILNYELDQNQRALELSNSKLAGQNTALEQANREIKEAEMQLVQSEKMSSLGRFSAGLMHDILNPLNYVRTGTFTLGKKCRQLPPELQAEFFEILTDMEDGLKRVEDIVADLRTFTHPGGQAAQLVSLTEISNVALRFVSNELKEKNISLELRLAPDQKIWFGQNQFILVLVNLLENAIDALTEKARAGGGPPTIQISSRVVNDRCLLLVRDNGSGIDPRLIAKIFDPFFTTKEVGQGTGLGLSICFGILRSHGATIAATSELGRFTEFVLDLPATEAAATQAKSQHAEPIRL